MSKSITVETTINAPVEKVWNYFSEPHHVTHWNFASDDWHAPAAETDLRAGGKFKWAMAAKDGSYAFDFEGTFTNVLQYRLIEYNIIDGRKVQVTFSPEGAATKVVETFEMENENSEELQRGGWQSILDNFKKYTEAN